VYEIVLIVIENLNGKNVIERLKYDELLGHSSETDIDFAASHFFNLARYYISDLRVSMFFKIVESKSSKLQSEDDLMK
jgi:hypothetical protein